MFASILQHNHHAASMLIVPAQGKPASMGPALCLRHNNAPRMLIAQVVRSVNQTHVSTLQRNKVAAPILTATVEKAASIQSAALLHREGAAFVWTKMTVFFSSMACAHLDCVFVSTRSVHHAPVSRHAIRMNHAALARDASKECVLTSSPVREQLNASQTSMSVSFQACVSVPMAFVGF